MLKGNRLRYVAIGGCLSAFLLSLSPPVYSQGNSASGQESAANVASEPAAPDAPVAPSKIESPIERIARALEAANAENNSPEKTEHDKADLRAQRNMARWAKWMFWVAFAQAILSAVGIWFIWYSLRLNRRATEAAIKAAEAANASLHIALAVEQPFLGPVHIGLERINNGAVLYAPADVDQTYNVYIRFQNYGRTHATLVGVSVDKHVGPTLPVPPVYGELGAIVHVLTAYAETKPGFCQATRQITLSAKEADSITGGASNLWIYGMLRYTDFVGNTHDIGFCQVSEPNKILGGRFRDDGPAEYRYHRESRGHLVTPPVIGAFAT